MLIWVGCIWSPAGCAWGGSDPDAGQLLDGAGEPAPADDPGGPDAKAEDGADASGADPEPTDLPIGPDRVLRIGEPGGVDVTSAAFETNAGLVAIWDTFDPEFTQARLRTRRSADGSIWTDLRDVPLGQATYRANPSLVRLDGQVWLYYLEASGLYSTPALRRSRWNADRWDAAEPVFAIAGVSSLLSWPGFYALANGGVATAFRDAAGHPKIALSADGRTFDTVLEVSASPAAMSAMGQFGDGSLAHSCQTGSGGTMTSWVRLSADGQDWTDPVRVSDSSSNVHDTTLVPRLDGGLDLYFIYPCSAAGFCLFRRSLASDGGLGPEQQVTLPEVGETSKPQVLRLGDGRLLVLWAEITRRAATGEPIEQVLAGAILSGDAP